MLRQLLKKFRQLKLAKTASAFRKNVLQLVPGKGKVHERNRSLALKTQVVKPFAFYSIKKDHVSDTKEVNTNTNFSLQEEEKRVSTEESHSRNNQRSVINCSY